MSEIPATMKAALWYAPLDVRFVDVPVPEIDDKGVLIKTKVTLTCGTDVKTYKRGYPGEKPGATFGHEVAGEIVKAGKDVEGFKVGDRVVTHNTAPCGSCYYCKIGRNDGECESLVRIKGGHSQYVAVPDQIVKTNLFHVPDQVPYKAAALVEPFSCAVYGADMTPVHFGDYVVILGAGPIGLMIAMRMKKKGAKVIHADFSAKRLEVSKSLGTDIVFDLTGVEDPVKEIRALTPDGRGADSAIDASGQPAAWENAINIVRKAGFVNLFGGCKAGTTITVDTHRIHYDGVTLTGFYHTTPRHVQMAADMIINGEIPVDTFVTGEYPWEQLIEAVEAHGRQEGIKNAINWD